ncbi:MAG: hypothetical protein KC983_12645 [Phycisphaerales bacterium]|nr:hypothetical protein [Phycisphaerales bacterium]
MSDVIAPAKTITFTIKKEPTRIADRKTVERLMRMQPDVQKGLTRLAQRRAKTGNVEYIRAGRPWVNRQRVTKLVRPEQGESFTIFVTPQILNDIRAVEKYLDAKPA